MIQWQSSSFSNLTVEDLYGILKARQEVFVLEQNCPFLDTDGFDNQSWHLWALERNTEGQVLLAYSRIVAPGVKYAEPSIGRVLTTNAGRGRGLGKELMKRSILKAEELYPGTVVRIGAQQYLERFYAEFGFHKTSETYLEDGIQHIEMLRESGQKYLSRKSLSLLTPVLFI